MIISTRNLLLGLCGVVFLIGAVLWFFMNDKTIGAVVMACSLLCSTVVIMHVSPSAEVNFAESQEMCELPKEKQHELLRGTGLHLREMKYRYSVRIDHNQTVDRCCFNADVNTIRLGFIPVVITDNATDKQGFGFVAFVYDGNRWLGPGLPCPGTKEQAIAHAQESVAPREDDATEQ